MAVNHWLHRSPCLLAVEKCPKNAEVCLVKSIAITLIAQHYTNKIVFHRIVIIKEEKKKRTEDTQMGIITVGS